MGSENSGGSGGSTWSQWAPWVAGALGAYGGYRNAQQTNQPQQSQGQGISQVIPNPTLNAAGNEVLQGALSLFRNPPQLPSGNFSGASGQTGNILNQLLNLQAPQAGSAGALTGFLNTALSPGDVTEADLASIPRYASRLASGEDPSTVLASARHFARNNPDSRLGQTVVSRQTSNPLVADVFGSLRGTNQDDTRALLNQFLASGQAFAPQDNGSGGGAPRPLSSATTSYRGAGGAFGSPAGGGGGGGGTNLNQQLAFFFDDARLDPLSDPSTQALLDILQRESAEDYDRLLDPIAAQMEAQGRFGSGAYNSAMAQVAEEAQEALELARTGMLGDFYQSALSNRLGAAGLLGQQEASQAAANAARSASSASYQAAQDRLALERELGLRGQDLQALGLLSAQDQFGLGLLGDLSANENAFRLGAGQLALGQEQNALAGGNFDLQRLLQAGGLSSSIDAANAAAAQARYQAQLRQAQQPWQNLGNVLGALGSLSNPNIFGSTSINSTLQSIPGGQQINPWLAGIQGGLGGYLGAGGSIPGISGSGSPGGQGAGFGDGNSSSDPNSLFGSIPLSALGGRFRLPGQQGNEGLLDYTGRQLGNAYDYLFGGNGDQGTNDGLFGQGPVDPELIAALLGEAV